MGLDIKINPELDQKPWPDTVHLMIEVGNLRLEAESLRERLAQAKREITELSLAKNDIADFARRQTEKLEEATARAIRAEQALREKCRETS